MYLLYRRRRYHYLSLALYNIFGKLHANCCGYWIYVIYLPMSFCLLHGPLRWRHFERGGVSNNQPRDCLLNRIFRSISKKSSKLRVTGFCAGNSPVTGDFPEKMASNVENVSIWWRYHDIGVIIRHPQWPGSNPEGYRYNRTGAPFTSTHIQSQHGWIITYPVKCGMKLLIHSQTSTVASVKFGNGSITLGHILPLM